MFRIVLGLDPGTLRVPLSFCLACDVLQHYTSVLIGDVFAHSAKLCRVQTSMGINYVWVVSRHQENMITIVNCVLVDIFGLPRGHGSYEYRTWLPGVQLAKGASLAQCVRSASIRVSSRTRDQ